jgi:hypothetical protein
MFDPRTLTYTELVSALQRAYADEARANEKHKALMRIGECASSALAEMVAAVDVDYDRLQELRDMHRAGVYVAGWNMPGYLPDNEPARFDDADDARQYLAEELENTADQIDDEDMGDPRRADWRAIAADLRAQDFEGSAAEWGQTIGTWHYWISFQPADLANPDEAEELAELESAAGDCEDEDDARQRIVDDPLTVEYRATWQPGETPDPEEVIILLTTGGPAVRIIAELGRGGVTRARLQVQDWFTPWTDAPCDSDTLVRYCEILGVGAEL